MRPREGGHTIQTQWETRGDKASGRRTHHPTQAHMRGENGRQDLRRWTHHPRRQRETMGDKGRRDIGKADTPVLHFANAAPVSAWSHAMKHDNSCTRHCGNQAVQFFRPQKPAAKNNQIHWGALTQRMGIEGGSRELEDRSTQRMIKACRVNLADSCLEGRGFAWSAEKWIA